MTGGKRAHFRSMQSLLACPAWSLLPALMMVHPCFPHSPSGIAAAAVAAPADAAEILRVEEMVELESWVPGLSG